MGSPFRLASYYCQVFTSQEPLTFRNSYMGSKPTYKTFWLCYRISRCKKVRGTFLQVSSELFKKNKLKFGSTKIGEKNHNLSPKQSLIHLGVIGSVIAVEATMVSDAGDWRLWLASPEDSVAGASTADCWLLQCSIPPLTPGIAEISGGWWRVGGVVDLTMLSSPPRDVTHYFSKLFFLSAHFCIFTDSKQGEHIHMF